MSKFSDQLTQITKNSRDNIKNMHSIQLNKPGTSYFNNILETRVLYVFYWKPNQ